MEDSTRAPPADRVVEHLERGEVAEALACLERIETAPADDRKRAMRSLRTVAEDDPPVVRPLRSALTSFLEDDERSVRLTTAKLFVALAESDPDTVLPVAPSLAERLADDEEFYYVRARTAEALGYVALEHPEEVASPELLADLRIGLSFDEPEVKEKLAKAIEHVALGDTGRLRHHVSDLAAHLDDEAELVRYHLATALVVIGCAYPDRVADASEALAARLADENQYVRGRAAEAIGLLARSDADDLPVSADDLGAVRVGEDESFVADRVRFARDALLEGEPGAGVPDGVGSVEAIRERTDEVLAAITSPAGEGECPNCGLELPENRPPMCPRCGVPC